MSRYYLNDGGHVLISGATGAKADYGGKTSTANWWFEQSVEKGHHDAGLFFNPKGHSAVRGVEVRDLGELARAYRDGARLFNYNPRVRPGETDGLASEFSDVAEVLRQLPGDWIVVADEAQDYRESAYLDWILSQGGNLEGGGFTALVLTQRPWNLSEELRGNMPVKIWVGPVTTEGRKFFQVENMSNVVEQVERETGPYHWAVTDGGDYQHVNPPVPEEYAT